MTDLAGTDQLAPAPARKRVTSASDVRLRKRYRAERRFRAYGILALVVTTLFLAFLLVEIVRTGWPAFTQHSLSLDVDVKADVVAPDGKRDEASLKSADYFPLLRDALKAAIPGIETRSGERTLVRLMSNGATSAIQSAVVANPSLIGSKINLSLPLGSSADLYFKGSGTSIRETTGRGALKLADQDGGILLTASSTEFAADLARIKATLADKARALAREADRLQRIDAANQADRIKELSAEADALRARAGNAKGEEATDSNLPSLLIALNGGVIKLTKLTETSAVGEALIPPKSLAEAKSGEWKLLTLTTPESNRKVTDLEVAFLEHLRLNGHVKRAFAWRLFTSGDSREPELAGLLGAVAGTALTLLVTLVITLPLGVMAAVYLEEFAPKNRLTDLIEVNINNLAAVPSIVFGLLGLAVFINFFGLPRSAPLVGGLVLALLVLPTIIIASRAAIKAVPPSIKEAALGVGASHQQAVFHHVLPLAMPGIMTGTIIGMAHALGETAPLLMIGMVAFIVDIPKGLTDAATVLPVQIFLWSDLPEEGFKTKTAAAICVLLAFLLIMNGAAIWLRKKFERRW